MIIASRHDRLQILGAHQLLGTPGYVEREILFQYVSANRTRILTAVTGVENHNRKWFFESGSMNRLLQGDLLLRRYEHEPDE